MYHLQEGQCGLCVHFGEEHANDEKLVQIRQTGDAPEDMVDECDHPKLHALHLKVTPISGCDAFEMDPRAKG